MNNLQNKSPDKETFDKLVNLLIKKKYDQLAINLPKIIDAFPKSYPLKNLEGAYNKAIGEYNLAEKSFKEAIQINKKIPDAHNNLGLLYIEQKKIDQSVECFKNAIRISPNNPFFYNNLGNALAQKNMLESALINYQKAVSIDKNFFLAHNNIGITQHKLKNFNEAIKSFQNTINIQNKFDQAYTNQGNTYYEIGNIELAIKNYKLAIEINPSSSIAYNNLGNVLKDQGAYNEALKNYEISIKLQPNEAETYNNLGNVLSNIAKLDEAILSYKKAIQLNPKYFECYFNLGNAYSKKKDLLNAVKYYEKSYEINNDYSSALVSSIFHKLKLSDWSSLSSFSKKKNSIGIEGEAVMPFYTLVMEDNPRNQMLRSVNYSNQNFEKFNNSDVNLKIYKNKKIKIGYYSSDFFDHATMFLISGLLREHNREEFEIFVFSYGNVKQSQLVDDTMKKVNLFKNINKMSDLEIVNLSRKLEIDIAIDLKGYTLNSRSKLFAYRLAPIQINYLGYPGTLGSSFIDYLVADKTLIPSEFRNCYKEKIVYLPNSYQPNDDKRIISKTTTSRSNFDLPIKGFVFCCFNTSYKITPEEIEVWSSILNKVNNSIIWLIDTDVVAKKNIVQTFKNKKIDESRIKFAKNLPHNKHLERIKHADLFLDTFNVNAHTTCSDTLWAGVPLVTKIGNQFAARVASSLLKAVNLDELITTSNEQYEKMALKLATNKDYLNSIKKKLNNNKENLNLFNTKKYTKNFEKALTLIYNRKLQEKDNCDFEV